MTVPTPQETARRERKRAGQTNFVLICMSLLDAFMLLGMGTLLLIMRDSIPPEYAPYVGTLRTLTAMLLVLFVAAVGAWLAVRERDRSARAIAVVAGLTHLLFFPLGTVLGGVLLALLPPKRWSWQERAASPQS